MTDLNLKTLSYHLGKPVSIAPLVTFRIVFGALMVFSTIRFMWLGWIEDHYLKPLFHFKYFGFSWVEVLPPFWMYVIHVVMIFAATGVMLGFFYRFSTILLFLAFTYTELIDLTYYLNHYYFVSIACGLMILIPAHRNFSLDCFRRPELISTQVPSWTVLIIKFQLSIVYIFAGLAKINYDWLIQAMPLKIWLPANDRLPLIGWMLSLPLMPYIFSWLGMVYDCTIIFWLSNSRTRVRAYLSVIFFHAVTGMMFQIGVFPLVMIAATLIFFSPQWHQNLISGLRISLQKILTAFSRKPFSFARDIRQQPVTAFYTGPLLKFFLLCFVVFQLVFPWRYLLYDGNLFWTEEGYRFSWRVMLMEKAGTATFYVKDTKTNREGVVVNSEFLNAHQEKQMAMQPDMILQFAHFLRAHYKQNGVYEPAVRAEVYVTLNARPSQLLVDPQVNLCMVDDDWTAKNWILRHHQ